MGVGPEKTEHGLIAWLCLRGSGYSFPRQCRVNPLKHQKTDRYFWGRECCSCQMWGGHFYWDCGGLFHSTKRTYQNTVAQFRDHLGSSHASPFKLIGSHSFPNNAFILTVGTWQCWEFKSGCTLASHRMRFYIWFSANLVLQLLYIKVSFRVYIETFKLFLWCLSWECKFLNTSFSFTTLSSDIRSNQQFHDISKFSNNVQKYQYKNSLVSSYKWLVRSNRCRYFFHLYGKFTSWTLHSLFTNR